MSFFRGEGAVFEPSELTRGPLKYRRVGTIVRPFSRVFPISRSISRLCISSLRGRSGSWFSVVAGGYCAMWTL